MMMKDVSLGIVTPMANEGPEGVRLVQEVLKECGGFRKVEHFVVLDNVTKDNSVELLREYATREPRLNVVWAPECRCLVDAYVRGYREALNAGCDWILEIDAGFSHDPANIRQFFITMEAGYDCVFGSRFMKGGRVYDSSFQRLMLSRGGTLLTNRLLGTRQTDMTSGFELFSAPALQKVVDRGIQSRAHFFQTEIKAYCRNLRFVEVPIQYKSASARVGNSAIKDSFRQLFRLASLNRKGLL